MISFPLIGKISEFGGGEDVGMRNDSGLSLYEPIEADRRPDIFYEEDSTWLQNHPEWAMAHPGKRQPTWSRLRTHFFYLAMRFDQSTPRFILQHTPFKISSTRTSNWCVGFLVDWGPDDDTGRVVDASPGIIRWLRLSTDDVVKVEQFKT